MDFAQWLIDTMKILGSATLVMALLATLAWCASRIIKYRHEFWLCGLILCKYRHVDQRTIDNAYYLATEALNRREAKRAGIDPDDPQQKGSP